MEFSSGRTLDLASKFSQNNDNRESYEIQNQLKIKINEKYDSDMVAGEGGGGGCVGRYCRQQNISIVSEI